MELSKSLIPLDVSLISLATPAPILLNRQSFLVLIITFMVSPFILRPFCLIFMNFLSIILKKG